MSSPDIAWLKAVYDGYAEGKIDPIFDRLAEGVEWVSTLVAPADRPLDGTFRGPDGVRVFFQAVARDWLITRFEVQQMIANGDLVVVSVVASATNRPDRQGGRTHHAACDGPARRKNSAIYGEL